MNQYLVKCICTDADNCDLIEKEYVIRCDNIMQALSMVVFLNRYQTGGSSEVKEVTEVKKI